MKDIIRLCITIFLIAPLLQKKRSSEYAEESTNDVQKIEENAPRRSPPDHGINQSHSPKGQGSSLNMNSSLCTESIKRRTSRTAPSAESARPGAPVLNEVEFPEAIDDVNSLEPTQSKRTNNNKRSTQDVETKSKTGTVTVTSTEVASKSSTPDETPVLSRTESHSHKGQQSLINMNSSAFAVSSTQKERKISRTARSADSGAPASNDAEFPEAIDDVNSLEHTQNKTTNTTETSVRPKQLKNNKRKSGRAGVASKSSGRDDPIPVSRTEVESETNVRNNVDDSQATQKTHSQVLDVTGSDISYSLQKESSNSNEQCRVMLPNKQRKAMKAASSTANVKPKKKLSTSGKEEQSQGEQRELIAST